MEQMTVSTQQQNIHQFCQWMEKARVGLWVLWVLNFSTHHAHDGLVY